MTLEMTMLEFVILSLMFCGFFGAFVFVGCRTNDPDILIGFCWGFVGGALLLTIAQIFGAF